jgi:cephalosporin hydroxylase
MTNKEFIAKNQFSIKKMNNDTKLKKLTKKWFNRSSLFQYSYHFTWLGLPIIQFPQDIIALQEIIWRVKPDLIIETGIARGGSLIFSASMLEMINEDGHVLGIDIDIRQENRLAIENHPMSKRITMLEGSSIDKNIAEKVYEVARNKNRTLIILDSNHTHEHVLEELNLYAKLTSVDSYCIVFDTVVEDMPKKWDWGPRTWGVGNNPKTAVFEFLKTNDNFEIDKSIDNKLLISVAPDGYLKRIK